MSKWLLTVIITCCSLQFTYAQGIDFVENKSWQEILDQSKQQDKLIFLDCYTTWCGPCKAMAKDVFPLKEVGDYMNPNFINVKLDMEKGEGIDLNKKYKQYIPGYPTYLIINGQGEVVHQVAGFNEASKFIAKIKGGLNAQSWIVYASKYAAGERDWDFLQTYLEKLEEAFQGEIIKNVTAEALPKLSLELLSENPSAYKIFRKYWKTTEGGLLASVLSSSGIYRKHKDNELEINEWAGRIYKRKVDTFVDSSIIPGKFHKAEAKLLIEELRRLSVGSREKMIALLLMSEAVADKNGATYLRLYNAAKEFGLLRYDQQRLSAWAKYLAMHTTDKVMLKQYLASVELPEKESQRGYAELRNYAFILDKLGEKAKAQNYYKEADKVEERIKEQFKAFYK